MFSPGIVNFDGVHACPCEQGATFDAQLTWKSDTNVPVKLKNYTARLQVRTQDLKRLIVEFSTENGRITLNPTSGDIFLHLDEADTSLLIVGTFVYDFFLIEPHLETIKLFEGIFQVTPQVAL